MSSRSLPEGSLTPSLSWLWPSGLTLSAMVTATLIAVFIYWGWDTTAAVNEESADPSEQPGRATIVSVIILVGTYVLVTIAAQALQRRAALSNPK